MTVGGRPVGIGRPTFLVAEIGGNHGGSEALASRMVEAAADCGVEAVKFQAYRTSAFLSRLSPYYDELAAEELSFEGLGRLVGQARRLGLAAGLTVFDPEGLDLARDCGADFIKISSGDLTWHGLIHRAARSGRPLFLSTGAADESEVVSALAAAGEAAGGLAVLQCASLYPSPPEAVNLAVMACWLSEGLMAGYSDHTLGTAAAKLAIALGAVVVEKHFTIDRSLPGGDNSISGLPDEFRELVRWRDECRIMLGRPIKRPHDLEAPLRPAIRRAIVAARDLEPGRILTADDLRLKRPPSSMEAPGPDSLDLMTGRRLLKKVPEDAPVLLSDLEED